MRPVLLLCLRRVHVRSFSMAGALDIVLTNRGVESAHNPEVTLLRGETGGATTFTQSASLPWQTIDGLYPDPASNRIALADFNGDGFLDVYIAVARVLFRDRAGFGDTLFLSNGQGNFQFHAPVVLAANSADVEVGDMNGDRHLDVVSVRADAPNYLLFGDGAGTFAASVLDSGNSGAARTSECLAIGDVDNEYIHERLEPIGAGRRCQCAPPCSDEQSLGAFDSLSPICA